MKRLPVFALLAILCFPVAAQKMGSVNNNAPVVGSRLAMGEVSVEISHTAINWSKGGFAKALEDQRRADRMRKRINDSAEKDPLGEVKVKGEANIGGKKVAAGDYKLFFTIDDKNAWTMVMKNDAARHEWKLDLKETKNQSTRLGVFVMPGEKDTAGTLTVRFGNQEATAPVEAGAKGEAKPAEGGRGS